MRQVLQLTDEDITGATIKIDFDDDDTPFYFEDVTMMEHLPPEYLSALIALLQKAKRLYKEGKR